MSKKIIIAVHDDDNPFVEFKERNMLYINELECEHILSSVRNRGINIHGSLDMQGEKFGEAIDILIASMVHYNTNQIVIDIDERNERYAEPMKMTLSEIEKVLGHKIELISEKKDDTKCYDPRFDF